MSLQRISVRTSPVSSAQWPPLWLVTPVPGGRVRKALSLQAPLGPAFALHVLSVTCFVPGGSVILPLSFQKVAL